MSSSPAIWMAVSALALTLTACATAPTPVEVPVETVVASPAPQPIDGYDWFLQGSEGNSSLAYGVADSDDLAISMDCQSGTRRVQVTLSAAADAEPVILLESGGETERLQAQSNPSEWSDGVFLTAEARSDLPVFQRFRDLGWMAVWEHGERFVYVPHEASRDLARQFLARCE
jgi:hypothetical protein